MNADKFFCYFVGEFRWATDASRAAVSKKDHGSPNGALTPNGAHPRSVRVFRCIRDKPSVIMASLGRPVPTDCLPARFCLA